MFSPHTQKREKFNMKGKKCARSTHMLQKLVNFYTKSFFLLMIFDQTHNAATKDD